MLQVVYANIDSYQRLKVVLPTIRDGIVIRWRFQAALLQKA